MAIPKTHMGKHFWKTNKPETRNTWFSKYWTQTRSQLKQDTEGITIPALLSNTLATLLSTESLHRNIVHGKALDMGRDILDLLYQL